MIGLGRMWKAVTGGKADAPAASTIPRAVPPPRPAAASRLGHEPAPGPVWPPSGSFPDPATAEPSETRSAERFVPNRTATVLTAANGKRFAARIINVSRTGVAVEPETAGVVPGEVTLVGTRPVTPGRRIALGMVFLFVKPLDPKLCGPDLVL